MLYDQLRETPEEGLAGNLRLPHGPYRSDDTIWLFSFGIQLQVHVQTITILICPVNVRLRKV